MQNKPSPLYPTNEFLTVMRRKRGLSLSQMYASHCVIMCTYSVHRLLSDTLGGRRGSAARGDDVLKVRRVITALHSSRSPRFTSHLALLLHIALGSRGGGRRVSHLSSPPRPPAKHSASIFNAGIRFYFPAAVSVFCRDFR